MTALYSPRWHRVAATCPRLAPGVTVRRQRLRGETWVQLADAATGRSVRLNAAAYALVGRFDGECTLQHAWDAQLQRPYDAATQDETIELLAQLREAGLLRGDLTADFDALLPHLAKVSRPAGRSSLIAWRLPLGNPGALLRRFDALAGLLFCRTGLLLLLLALAHLLLQAVQHAPTLWAHGQTWLAQPRFMALAALLFVPIKLWHELAHGMAVRRWGGQVRQAGVTFMLGMPMPYVDASAASAFSQRYQRVVVSAAGMMAETCLAAAALPLWLVLEPGLARDTAFVTLVLTSVSTLVFNANPLLRLDGYYIASDLLQLPNLAPRSQAWWHKLLQRRVLRLPEGDAMLVARGEGPWLMLYAPLAWANGLVVATLAAAWLGQWSMPLGLLAAALLLWQMALRPLWRLLSKLQAMALARDSTARRWRRLRLAGLTLVVLALGLPLPQRSLVRGVVWPADDAQLRAEAEGQVEAVLVADGSTVQTGTVILRLANPPLRADHTRQAARVAALEARLYGAMPGDNDRTDAASAGVAQAELAAARAELALLDQRLGALQVRARSAGRLALPHAADLPGRHLRQGALLGQILGNTAATVRVALPEAQAQDLRQHRGAASVWLASSPGQVHNASLLRDSGGAGLRLPSAALSLKHGGPIATEPGDKDDLTALQPVLLLDVRLPPPGAGPDDAGAAPSTRLGERAWVRFDGGFSPLAWQLARRVRREMLQHFNPQV